ncbi:hypothetical protein PG991_000025 [Apiospora marii]|uniref:Uncharacterized protein n=1 Tax=Apiospora marii TaxID=335849 RepID=A0ABR1T1C0_9PEZI
MSDRILPVRSGTLPVLSSLAIELVEILDDPERSYEDVWDVVKQMALDMCDMQSLIRTDDTVAKVFHEDEMADESTFLLLHTLHPRVLRSLCMGTVAYEFHDEQSAAWCNVYSEHGPGAYAVGIAVTGRNGKFLTAIEIRALINILQTYAAGCAAWDARSGDVLDQLQLNQRQTTDLAWAMEIDSQYPLAGRVTPTSDMQAEIEAENDTAAHVGREASEGEMSQDTPRPRFSSSVAGGIHALVSMFERRLMYGASPSEPQVQSPLLIGSSHDLQTRKQDCRPNMAAFNSGANLYGLLMSCIKFMGLEPRQVFVPLTKAWQVSQINRGEVLGTILASSLVSMAGLNVYDPGAKNEVKPLPTDAIFEETRNESQVKKVYDEIFSVTDDDIKAAVRDVQLARNSLRAAILEAEKAVEEKEEELDKAKKVLDDAKARREELSGLDDELFNDYDETR